MIPKMFKNKKGFSYFELLAILVFIGIIATISFNFYGNFKVDGELAARQLESVNVQEVVSEYIERNGEAPTVIANVDYGNKPALLNLTLIADDFSSPLKGNFYIYGLDNKVSYDYPISYVEKQYNKYNLDKGVKPLISNSNYIDMKLMYEQSYFDYRPLTSYTILTDGKIEQMPPMQDIPLKSGDISNAGENKPTTPTIDTSKEAPFYTNDMIIFSAKSHYSKGKVTYEWENISSTGKYAVGTHIIGVTAVGEDGVRSDKATFNLVVGGPNAAPTKPVISITPSKTTYLSSDIINLNASSTDPDGDTIKYKWLGTTSTNQYPIGNIPISVYAEDSYGNKSEVEKVMIKVVNSPPVIKDVKHFINGVEVPKTQTIKATDTVTFEPVVEDYDKDLTGYQVVSGLSSNNKYPIGSHTIQFKAWDTLKQTTDYSYTFTVSNTPPTAPTITINPTTPRVLDNITYSASGSTDADNHVISYEYKLDGGSWSSTPPNGALNSGSHTIYARAKDSLGAYSSITSKQFSVGQKQIKAVIDFPAGTSMQQSKVYDMGTSRFWVDAISVDTGDVTYSNWGSVINITVNNGQYVSRDAYIDPQMYSKYATTTETGSYDVFPPTISYTSTDGYSGNLSTSGESYVVSGTAGTSVSRLETTSKPGTIYHDYACWNRAWTLKEVRYVPSSFYYTTWDKYSGTVVAYSGSPTPTAPANFMCMTNGDIETKQSSNANIMFRGTVTYTTPDTYVYEQQYTGTIYKSGTNYTNYKYGYSVTLYYTVY